MDNMIEQQMFALDMEALTNRLKRLEIQDKVITLLNDLWDQIYITTTERRTQSKYLAKRMEWKSRLVN